MNVVVIRVLLSIALLLCWYLQLDITVNQKKLIDKCFNIQNDMLLIIQKKGEIINNLKNIIEESKVNKENYYKTLEKIEKELFK